MNTVSYWEQKGFGKADWVVIGAGLVGLQSARRIKQHYKNARVLVLDEQSLGRCASLRNAGFACYGSAGEMLDEIDRSGESDAVSLFEKRYKGIQQLLQRYGADKIGFQATGGIEVFSGVDTNESDRIEETLPHLNYLLKDVIGGNAFEMCDLRNTGMNVLKKGIKAPEEGGIQTDLLYRAVRQDALQAGVEIYDGMKVVGWHETSESVVVLLESGLEITSARILLCTNGFSKKLLPELAVAPARGQVFVTNSLGELSFKGIFHADQGYIYFRELGNRLLIGGARNLDFVGEETMDMGITDQFREHLKLYVETVILPGKKVNFEYEWSGVMGMDMNRNPIIGWHSNRVCLAVRMGGMGVALSSWVADEVVRVVVGDLAN